MSRPAAYTPLEMTAIHAIACKSSAVRRGYNRISAPTAPTCAVGSEAAAPHCPRKNYQTPLLNRMYYCRCTVVKHILQCIFRSILDVLEANNNFSESIQLLVLGAGFELFDYFPDNISVYLVDLPGITKSRISAESGRTKVKFVAADLRHPRALIGSLQREGFQTDTPSVILLESVLSYIADDYSNDLLKSLDKYIPWANIVLYDVTLPKYRGGFSKYTEKNFQRGNAPLLSARASPLDLSLSLRSNGWKHVSSASVQQALDLFVDPELTNIPMALEPFDEFAALAVLNTQYAVAWACNNSPQFRFLSESLIGSKQINLGLNICSKLSPHEPEIPDRFNEPLIHSADTLLNDRLRRLNARIGLLLERLLSVQLLAYKDRLDAK